MQYHGVVFRALLFYSARRREADMTRIERRPECTQSSSDKGQINPTLTLEWHCRVVQKVAFQGFRPSLDVGSCLYQDATFRFHVSCFMFHVSCCMFYVSWFTVYY